MTATRHLPVRTCVVCNSKKGKFGLLRLALDPEKWIVGDDTQRIGGRGAYVCPECLPRLRFTGRVQKAFRNQARGLAKNILQQPSILQKNGTSEDSEERRPRCSTQSIVQQGGSFHGAHEGA